MTFEFENVSEVGFVPQSAVFAFMDGETTSGRLAFDHNDLKPYMLGDTLRKEDGVMMVTVGASEKPMDAVVCTMKGTDEKGNSLTFTGTAKLLMEMATSTDLD